MDNLMSTFIVPAYFLHGAIGLGVLAWWFLTRNNSTLKMFGKGLLGYALGMAAWALLVIVRPSDLKPLILIGVIPFALAHLAYAKVGYKDLSSDKSRLMVL